MSASTTLLVFETNPEHLDFYLVDLESKQASAARHIAGLRMGVDTFSSKQEQAFEALNNWFGTEAGQATKQGPHLKAVNIKEVIHFGIIL